MSSPSSNPRLRIALGADDVGPLTDALLAELGRRGHEVSLSGALAPERSTAWASIGREVAEAVVAGRADWGIVCCWTGTGIAIAANKVRGARAALCADAQTAQGARRWNDANILALSLRATAPAVGLEILDAFFATQASGQGEDREQIAAIEEA